MLCTECSEVVKPIVCLDIDGTLGEYHRHLLEFMHKYFGHSLQTGWTGAGNWEDYLGLTQEQYREAKLAFRQGGMKRTMPLIPGADSLPRVAKALGAEVWITTTRPWMRLDSVDPDTREWLRRNGIEYDHLLYDEHKYPRLAEIVDAERVVFVLDDLPEMVREALEVFKWDAVYLLRRQHNFSADIPERRIVQNIHEAERQMVYNINQWKAKYHG